MGRRRGPPLILLDTHAWIWWRNGSRELSRRASKEIDRQAEIGVTAISCWELAMLEARNCVRFDRGASSWLKRALADERTVLFPVTGEIAVRAGQLHRAIPEPADALIYATALHHDSPLVTRDEALRMVDPTRVIW